MTAHNINQQEDVATSDSRFTADVSIYPETDQYGKLTKLECILRRGKAYHHYITSYTADPVSTRIDTDIDKWHYDVVGQGATLLDFCSIQGTIFACSPANDHLYFPLCVEQIGELHRISVTGTNIPFITMENISYLRSKSFTEPIQLIKNDFTAMPNTIIEGTDIGDPDEAESATLLEQYANQDDDDFFDFGDMNVEDPFDTSHNKKELSLEAFTNMKGSWADDYDDGVDDEVTTWESFSDPNSHHLWESRLLLVASLNPVVMVVKRSMERYTQAFGRTINVEIAEKTIYIKLPSMDLTDDVNLIHHDEDLSLIGTLIKWIKSLRMTNYSRKWLFSYLYNLIDMSIKNNPQLRSEID
jgi:hypothetical protein